jgi:hypothetical protein
MVRAASNGGRQGPQTARSKYGAIEAQSSLSPERIATCPDAEIPKREILPDPKY